MSDEYALTPRVFIVRHGETDWAKIGRFTGISERELTNKGLDQVKSTAAMLVGPGKLLDSDRLVRIYVSPRKRAVKTFELLLPTPLNVVSEKACFTEDIAEWGYGRYEGMKNLAIRDERKKRVWISRENGTFGSMSASKENYRSKSPSD